jgi:hypothetical protein
MESAKQLFGKNFIGPGELNRIAGDLNIRAVRDNEVPFIPFSDSVLRQTAHSHILFLGVPETADRSPLSLARMRDFFGMDPAAKAPCFYNQDWYTREDFFNECRIELKWYLLRKELIPESRGKGITGDTPANLPTALVCSFAFFSWYFHTGEYLWEKDFVWCADMDANGDRIYVGRYFDPAGIAKNGFSIHRHLRIREHYGSIDMIG